MDLTPAVESGPTSWRGTDGTVFSSLSILQLIEKKEKVETELRELGQTLGALKVDMNTSLTTFDGYPRSDIDIAQIRTVRNRIIHVRNDYKVIMQLMEDGLHKYFAAGKVEIDLPSREQRTAAVNSNHLNSSIMETPFARIGNLVQGSPAADAGLEIDDKVLKFGNITWLNHEKLSKVRSLVQISEGQTIIVKVMRQDEPSSTLELIVRPRLGWGGSGLLGCTLFPL